MGRRWTEVEDLWLKQVWPKTEILIKAMAHVLKRTERAVQARASKLRVGRPWVGTPKFFEHLKRMHDAWSGSPKNLEQLERLHKTWLGSPEGKENLKRMQKKAQETWIGSPEHLEQWREAQKKAQETWLGSPENLEHMKRMQEIAQETWNSSSENLEVLKRARAASYKKMGAKPTWPEARFYGLVYGYNGLSEEFRAQQLIPTDSCDRIVDGLWKNVILELDGGGHHMFGDRTERDHLTDTEHQKMGYQVIRAKTSSILFLRLLQVIEESKPLYTLNTVA